MKNLLSLWDTSPWLVGSLFVGICSMVVFHTTEVQLPSIRKLIIAFVSCVLATIFSIFVAEQVYTRICLISAVLVLIVSYITSDDDEKSIRAIFAYYILIAIAITIECSGFS